MIVLNLGCGEHPEGRGMIPPGAEVTCHDRFKHSPWVDVAHNLQDFPWPFSNDWFDYILMFDVIEHLPDTLATMNEAWRILKPGGELLIHTNNIEFPAQAFRDPTHVRYFQFDSFDFFDPDTVWGRAYGRLYTNRYWRIEEKQRVGQEIQVLLQKRG